jgi:hypothetical protein
VRGEVWDGRAAEGDEGRGKGRPSGGGVGEEEGFMHGYSCYLLLHASCPSVNIVRGMGQATQAARKDHHALL